jgi:hypothetical protein
MNGYNPLNYNDIGRHLMDISKLVFDGAVLAPALKDGLLNIWSIAMWLAISVVIFTCGTFFKNLKP